MLIGIDASRAFDKDRTGIEEYSFQVIEHLVEELKGDQVVLYVRKSQVLSSEFLDILPDGWEIKKINWLFLWTQIGLSLEMLFHPVDVLFIPAHTVPVIHPQKTIVTVHGLEYEFFPGGYSFWGRLYMRWSIKLSCRWAKKIISVSENTKKDLIKLYQVSKDKIEVIYEGYNNSDFPASNASYQIANPKSPYLLFIGRIEKRKNVEGIIEAFEILREKYKVSHKLILAGKPGYGYESIRDKVINSKHKEEITLSGFVSEKNKYALLQKADVFMFPSFYEGFGLPILEAQMVGVPVITSNVSSMPEISMNNSALLTNPNFPGEIAEATYNLISNKNMRNDIIKKGKENANKFSWDKCSRSIAKLVKNL